MGETIMRLIDSQLATTNLALLRIWFCHTFSKVDQIAKLRVISQLVDKNNDCFSVDGICYHCNTVFEAMGCYYHYCPCQEARPSLTDSNIERGMKKRQQDEMRRDYIQQKGYQIVKHCLIRRLYKKAILTGFCSKDVKVFFLYKV